MLLDRVALLLKVDQPKETPSGKSGNNYLLRIVELALELVFTEVVDAAAAATAATLKCNALDVVHK